MSLHMQDEVQAASLNDPEAFWTRQANELSWHQKPSRALDISTKTLQSGASHPHWSWFPDGQISTCYNCVDRHVASGHGDSVAIIWDSPVTGKKERYTYSQLLREVEILAAVLAEEGVQKGDVVLIYMPMVPAALFACLAVSRLGAIHAVVFGGFAAPALAQRIDACEPRVVMTASCGIEGTKAPLDYKPLVKGALEKSAHKIQSVIVWQRDELIWQPIERQHGERHWQGLVRKARSRRLKADVVPVKSTDGVYIIYTSGTTGLPKGVLREAGGHAVGLQFSMRYIFGIRGPGDVMFCASDIGWVVGHSYILYAPLLVGATTVLYEGKPVGTPDAGSFWRIAEEYMVNVLFTAPTALRAIRREDPESKYLAGRGEQGGLRSLRALFLAGERSEPSIVQMYQELLSRFCAPSALVVDNWWSSESGSPISGLSLLPAAASSDETQTPPKPHPMKPGSAGKPMPGWDVRIVDDAGVELAQGTMGNIVLQTPLAPTGFRTLWKDEERFYKGYLKRFGAKWLDTGDAGMLDEDGYLHVLSRSDDIINVAAHRFSTGAIEQCISSHPSVAECCVVGIPDPLKGHLPFAFVTLSGGGAASPSSSPSSATPPRQLFEDIQSVVRSQIGPIASLGGMIVGRGMIPKTRSGKTLRRVLRQLVEDAVRGDFAAEVSVPATVEDAGVVEVARARVREYFEGEGGREGKGRANRAKL